MIIAYKNKIDNITASSENPSYPIINALNVHLSKYWKSVGNNEWVKISYDSATNVDSVFIGGSNVTTNIILEGNDTDSWSSPSFTTTLIKDDGIQYKTEIGESYKYWRLVINDSTIDVIKIGNIMFDDNHLFANPLYSFNENRIDTSVIDYSASGQTYGDIGYIYRVLEMNYPIIDKDEKDLLIDIMETTHKVVPIYVLFNNDYPPLYCVIAEDIVYTHLKKLNMWTCKMILREVF